MLLHYRGKLKNQKFGFLMHVKVSNVTFYHLSNCYLPNIMKINVRNNTVKIPTLYACCSFTVLNIPKECLIAVWCDFQQVTIDTAVDQWRKRPQACVRANGGHFEHLLCTNLQTIWIFHVFLVQVASIHRVSFLPCWCLIVDMPTVQIYNLVKDNERTKKQHVNVDILHGVSLCTYFKFLTFGIFLSDG